jgi:hypothetical protein
MRSGLHRFIPYTALSTAVGRAAETLAVPDSGLRLSRLQDLKIPGPIAALARNSDTIESALLGVIKYLHTYSPAITAELHTKARESSFTFTIALARVPYREKMIEPDYTTAVADVNDRSGDRRLREGPRTPADREPAWRPLKPEACRSPPHTPIPVAGPERW